MRTDVTSALPALSSEELQQVQGGEAVPYCYCLCCSGFAIWLAEYLSKPGATVEGGWAAWHA
jgi:hypothetical protein